MKNRRLFYGILVICISVTGGVVGGIGLTNYLNRSTFTPIPEEQEPAVEDQKPASKNGNCGMENCHGLDITCGSNIPEICTMEYALGDNCRQYASCKIIDGKCKLVRSAEFDKCKSCVEKCLEDFEDDPVKLFECESECAE